MANLEEKELDTSVRVSLTLIVIALAFLTLLLRLWYLQIVKGDHFRYLSENNRIRTVYVPAPRGIIYDRNGQIVAKNRPSFNIELVVEDSPNPVKSVEMLEVVLGTPSGMLLEKLKTQSKRRPFEPKIILKDVSRDILAKVSANRYRLPGIIVGVAPTRDYIYGQTGAHLIGYIREITKDQLDLKKDLGYRQGEFIGQYGIEAKYEQWLKGVDGLQRVEVNASGTRIGENSFEAEKIGHDIHLTIDLEVQKAADLAMKDHSGAVVAMAADTGEILALTSTPAFDPNVFTTEVTPDEWKRITSPQMLVMSNRAVQGAYPPGSVFKAIMAVAGLSEGVIDKNSKVFCPGFLNFAGRNYRCHKKSGHGTVDLIDGMAVSCDVYYYTLGQRLGVDRINEYSRRFGLGRDTGLGLIKESKGLIPSTEWKRKFFKRKEDQKWFAGETLSVSIGQGAVTTTPLQIVRAISGIVNGGFLVKPFVVSKVVSSDPNTNVLAEFKPEVVEIEGIDKKILELVKEAMIAVVNKPGGTGGKARLEGITVGGKTGTAQVVSLDRRVKKEIKGGKDTFEDHAWFVGFAPAQHPEIVAVALVENAGHGGSVAAPVIRQVFEAYFNQKKLALEKAK